MDIPGCAPTRDQAAATPVTCAEQSYLHCLTRHAPAYTHLKTARDSIKVSSKLEFRDRTKGAAAYSTPPTAV